MEHSPIIGKQSESEEQILHSSLFTLHFGKADGKPPTRFAPISDGATSDATRPSECKHSWLSLLPRFARIVDKTFNEVKADTFNEVKADTFNEVQVFY